MSDAFDVLIVEADAVLEDLAQQPLAVGGHAANGIGLRTNLDCAARTIARASLTHARRAIPTPLPRN